MINLKQMGEAQQPAPITVGNDGQQVPQKSPATPEQQAQFDAIVGSCRQIIAGTAEEWMVALQKDPARTAVKMGTQVLRHMVTQYEKAGTPIAPEVLIHAGVTLVKDIAQIVNDAGIVPDDKLESFLQQVTQESIAEYLRMDADAGLIPKRGEGQAGQEIKGDPTTPDDSMRHESAETPAFESKEVEQESASEAPDEETEMQMQLAEIRRQKGVKS